jgi:ribosomal protein L12E/L44/L45/RPP1/RPP2
MAMDMSVALKINAGVTGQQAVDQLRTSMDKLNGAATSVGRGFDMAKTAVGAFLGLQVAQGVLMFARETINAADQLDEMSERTGIAVDTLSELRFAAQMNGKALEDVQSALQRVSVKATDAATGNKAAALAFDALGISVKNADGSMRSSLAITEDIGDAFRGIEDPTLKAALAPAPSSPGTSGSA